VARHQGVESDRVATAYYIRLVFLSVPNFGEFFGAHIYMVCTLAETKTLKLCSTLCHGKSDAHMTDAGHQGGRTPPDPAHSVSSQPVGESFELQYPRLVSAVPFDLLLSCSSSLASSDTSAMASPETYTGGLEESWTSFEDNEFSREEEDLQSEHTDVGSLLDAHGTEDVQSIPDEDSASNFDHSDESDVDEAPVKPTMRDVPPFGFSTGRSYPIAEREMILLGEGHQTGPHSLESDPVDVLATVKVFANADVEKLRAGCGRDVPTDHQCFGSLRMTLLKQGPDVGDLGYFRVLLLGAHISRFRLQLERKLGDALVARSSTSHTTALSSVNRYHVVPDEFGPGSRPTSAELCPIHCEIDFDHYDTADSGCGDARQSITLRSTRSLSDAVSEWNGKEFVIRAPRWVQPDLAVVCVDKDDTQMTDSSQKLLAFARRHGIPTLVIRADSSWSGRFNGAITSPQNLHACIEYRTARSPTPEVLQRLPVDISSFLRLDNHQLSQHIAYLLAAAQLKRAGSRSFAHKRPREAVVVEGNVESRPRTKLIHPRKTTTARVHHNILKPLLLALATLALAYLTSTAGRDTAVLLSLYRSARSEAASPTTTIPSSPSTSTHRVQSATSISLSGSTDHEEKKWSTSRGISPLPALQRSRVGIAELESVAVPRDGMAHYHVKVAGDNHLIVRLPELALNHKRRSPMSANVERAGKSILSTVHELFDGVYSVELPPSEAYGTLDIILNVRRPALTERVTVSFGSRFEKYGYWQSMLDVATEHFHSVRAQWENHTKQFDHFHLSDDAIDGLRKTLQNTTNTLSQVVRHQRWIPDVSTIPFAQFRQHLLDGLNSRDWPSVMRQHVAALAQETTLRGTALLAQASSEISQARAVVMRCVEYMNTTAVVASLRDGVRSEKLAEAQAGARQLVSMVASKLRACNVGR